MLLRSLCIALGLTLSLAAVAVLAEPVGPALQRPAIVARQPAAAMLLGAAQAGERLVTVGERGIVLVSDDQGGHWRQAKVPTSVTLTAVRFTDATNGIAVGHGGIVLTSDDAGATWTRRLDGRQAAEIVLKAAEASGDAQALRAARQLVADGPDKPLFDVLALDPRHALVVGAYGLALATEDGGRSWTSWMARLPNPKGLHLYAVRSRGRRILIAAEQGLVLKSEDGGRSFAHVATPYAGSWFTLELPGDDEIVLAGLRGNVWRSTDGGVRWVQVATPVPVSVTGTTLLRDGSVALVNQAGMVMTSRDGTLSVAKTPPLPPLNAVLARTDGSLLALGVQGVVDLSGVAR